VQSFDRRTLQVLFSLILDYNPHLYLSLFLQNSSTFLEIKINIYFSNFLNINKNVQNNFILLLFSSLAFSTTNSTPKTKKKGGSLTSVDASEKQRLSLSSSSTIVSGVETDNNSPSSESFSVRKRRLPVWRQAADFVDPDDFVDDEYEGLALAMAANGRQKKKSANDYDYEDKRRPTNPTVLIY
jgi:hypothetical protein